MQSITSLNRDFFVRSFVELIKHLDIDTNNILKIIKSLYDVFEVDNHWFVIYHAHHVNKLEMFQLIYDLCFLHTNMKIDTSSDLQTDLKDDSFLRTNMNIVNMQMNDILILIDSNFATAKKKAIIDVKIMIKSRDNLESNFSLKFNDTIIERQKNDICLKQLSQFDHLQLIKNVDIAIINFKDKIKLALISKKQYVAQRVRDAYVVSICQFETSFDLSFAAQSIEISSKNITTLNKRLQWQIDNYSRDINYVKLDSTKLRLMILTNSFFANNRDLFS